MNEPTHAVPDTIARLIHDFDDGRRPALARAISVVENQRPGFRDLLSTLHARIGAAHRIGITGPPGAGKSTLTAALIAHYRGQGETVAVVAVDPTSPFTGGALLGDRIRMNEISMDAGVFIRSMATRGSLGGLALATKEVADVMDAFGFDRILVETVGVGQSELDIAAAADSTVVVLVPESGDGIQAMKAGLMEAADLFVVNKADRPGADRLAKELSTMLHFRTRGARTPGTQLQAPAHHGVDMKRIAERARAARTGAPAPGQPHADDPDRPWEIPVLKTTAEKAEGVPELAAALERHRSWLAQSGELSQRRRNRVAERVREEVARSLQQVAWQQAGGEALLQQSLPALEGGTATPYEVAAAIVQAAIAR